MGTQLSEGRSIGGSESHFIVSTGPMLTQQSEERIDPPDPPRGFKGLLRNDPPSLASPQGGVNALFVVV